MQKELKPELRFPEFEKDWEEKKMESIISDVQSGVSVNSVNEPINDYEVGILKTSCVSGGQFLSFENKKILDEEISRAKLNPRKGNIIFSRMNTPNLVGESGYISENYPSLFLPDRLWLLNINESEANPLFVSILMSSSKMMDIFSSIATGTSASMKNISQPSFLNVAASFPSLPEQTKIANFLSALDEKIQALTKKKTLLEEYKKGVMQRLFTQEIRFKDEQGQDFPDWEEKKLGEIASFFKGKGISKADIVDNGKLECIRYGELYTHYQETIQKVISRTDSDPSNLVFSKYNDVIIPASGETQLDIAKASCVLKDGVALGGDLNILRTKTNGVFLSYYLNFGKKQEIAALAQGISVVHLYSSQLATLILQMPTLDEQQKIANFLTALDEKITKANQQIETAQTFKKGLLQKMFV